MTRPPLPVLAYHTFQCPHCWQANEVALDLSVAGQTMIQDCEVCCNPIEMHYTVEAGALDSFTVESIEQ